MDLQTTAGIIDLAVKAATILLLIIASSIAIKKKNNICLIVVILGNLIAFYFTQSPLICMIVSIACIFWAGMTKTNEDAKNDSTKQDSIKQNSTKQTLKSSKSYVNPEVKKVVKPGPIIGLIIGILMAGFPIVGFMIGEGSLSDSQGKMIGFGFIIFGAFMVIVNIIVLVTGKENLLASSPAPAQTTTIVSTAKTASKDISDEDSEDNKDMIRCRFCKKRYSSEYNGCPYCKKK